MKRLAAGASLVTLSVSLLVTGRADAQKYPQRLPYDRFDRSRPDRDHIAPPPPVITSAPTPRGVAPAPGVPSREFVLPPDRPFDAGPKTYAPQYAPRYDSASRPLRPYAYGYGYGSGAAPLYTLENANTAAPSAEAAFAPGVAESVGRLFIDTEPATAQVFVDGIPVGAVADFRGVGVLLTEGLRRVELRAPGYEIAAFDINIVSGQAAVHRGDLTPVRTAAGPVAPPIRRGSDTIYVIPGCYLGNKPPRELSLPRGCDIAKAKTIK
jgi:hypothetical protein